MMLVTGYPCLIVLRIHNELDVLIDEVEIFYENVLGRTAIKEKKIKPGKVKNTGISTIKSHNDDLKMSVLGKTYIIKEGISKNYLKKIFINIKSIDKDGNVIFIVKEEE